MNNSNKNISKLGANSIEAEAMSWIAQLDGDEMSTADRIALRDWASRSPKHRSELRRLAELWYDFDEALDAELFARNVEPSLRKTVGAAFKVRPKIAYGFASLAATALFAVAVFFAIPSNVVEPSVTQIAYSVPLGENKIIALDDGSQIHANTESLLEVEYDDRQRIIRLIKGEAHFDVAHDETRPFLVYASGNVVRAVGTAFVVRIRQDETSVIVTEGKVELKKIARDSESLDDKVNPIPPVIKPALISAGEALVVKELNTLIMAEAQPISEVAIGKKLAWRNGMIIFDGETLEYVVDEISRYTDSEIVISDPEIRNMPFGGAFKAGEVDELLGALTASFNIKVERVDDNVVYLRKAQGG